MRSTTPPVPGTGPPQLRRILAIKFYGLGNIIMLLPALSALRKAYPDAEIDFLTMAENRSLLERSGAANQVLALDVSSYGALARGLWQALRTMRARRYDLVIDFEQFIKLSAILAFLSGAPERIGFNTDGQRRGWLYTIRVVYLDSEHMSRIFMRVLRPLGIDQKQAVSIPTKPEEDAIVTKLLADHGVALDHFPIIAVHIGSGPNFYRVPLKRWPVPHFARLCDALIEGYGAAIVFTGKGPEEQKLIHQAMAQMKHPAVDTCDRLSIMELTSLLRQSHLTIANDTSVMHLSAAIGTRLVAFFGPSSPVHYGPENAEDMVFYKDLYCSPCLSNYNLKVSRCADPVCMRTISVEEVLQGIHKKFLGVDASSVLSECR